MSWICTHAYIVEPFSYNLGDNALFDLNFFQDLDSTSYDKFHFYRSNGVYPT